MSASADTAPARAAPSPPRLHDQQVVLPRVQLVIVLAAVALVAFIVTFDSSCVSTATPVIATDLGSGGSTTWVGTSYLVANSIPQVIAARLSDIFGRKSVLQVSLALFFVGNLLSGFAQNDVWLYTCRAIAGLGGGALSSMANIVISDVVTIRERGRILSFLGIPIGLGLGIAPEIGGALSEKISWRWAFWITCPVTILAMIAIQLYLPLKATPGRGMDKLKQIDWMGSVLGLAGIVMLLVPIASGGTSFAWSSSTSITLFILGGLITCAFIVAENYAKYPIIPLRLFKILTVNLVMITMILVGIVLYSNLYVAALYFQNILGHSAIMSGVLILPLVISQVIVMMIVGFAIKKWGKTRGIIIAGYFIWTAGQGAQIAWGTRENIGLIVVALLLQGIGFGMTSQTTLVLAMAVTDPADRAVLTGTRNLFRTAGGAIGLAACTAIINSIFTNNLPTTLPESTLGYLKSNGFSRNISGITIDQQIEIVNAYYHGIRATFIFFTPLIALCFLFCLSAKDANLPEAKKEVAMRDSETPGEPESKMSQSETQNQSDSIEMTCIKAQSDDPIAPLKRNKSFRSTRLTERS